MVECMDEWMVEGMDVDWMEKWMDEPEMDRRADGWMGRKMERG
jgi:hypothetical protein